MLNDKQIKMIESVKDIISLKIFINGESDAPQFCLKLNIQIENQTNSDLIIKDKS